MAFQMSPHDAWYRFEENAPSIKKVAVHYVFVKTLLSSINVLLIPLKTSKHLNKIIILKLAWVCFDLI